MTDKVRPKDAFGVEYDLCDSPLCCQPFSAKALKEWEAEQACKREVEGRG